MERETKTITTPSGASVKIKTYITGGESEQIQDILYKSVNLSAIANENNKEANLSLNNGSFITEQTHKAIEIMVVSVDDNTDKILDTILEMRLKDYMFVTSEIEKITKDAQEEDQSAGIKKK